MYLNRKQQMEGPTCVTVEQIYGLFAKFRVVAAGGIWSFGSGGSSEDHLNVCNQLSVCACMGVCTHVHVSVKIRLS